MQSPRHGEKKSAVSGLAFLARRIAGRQISGLGTFAGQIFFHAGILKSRFRQTALGISQIA
jgi:hypothetical protein